MTITDPRPESPSGPVSRFPEELVKSATFLLKRLGYAAKERAMRAYDDLGLHPYHHAILLLLDEGSRETQGSIADSLGYDRGQLVGLLDELETQGLVERRRDPNDRRRHLAARAGDRLGRDPYCRLRRASAVARRRNERAPSRRSFSPSPRCWPSSVAASFPSRAWSRASSSSVGPWKRISPFSMK